MCKGQINNVTGFRRCRCSHRCAVIFQLKKTLISEGWLALEFDCKKVEFGHVKEVYNCEWVTIKKAVIKDEVNPLYIVDPLYFPVDESINEQRWRSRKGELETLMTTLRPLRMVSR